MTVPKRKAMFSPILVIVILVAVGGGLFFLREDPKAEIKDLKSVVQVNYGAKKYTESAVNATKGLALAQKHLGNKSPDTLYFAQAVSEGYIASGDKKNAVAALNREIDLRLGAGQTEQKLQLRRTTAIKYAEEIGDKASAAKHAVAVAKAIEMAKGKDPQPVYRTETKYPPEQFNKGIEGDVEISYSLDANGAVLDATVAKAKPAVVFDTAALDSFRTWRFTPMLEDGKPVPSQGHKFTLLFRLGGQNMAPPT
ncbi:MAG: energy transducer TonB [Rhodospirillaceae bacterium]|nr:energy transducer TonB [Rhodospirillaceae bacterium]